MYNKRPLIEVLRGLGSPANEIELLFRTETFAALFSSSESAAVWGDAELLTGGEEGKAVALLRDRLPRMRDLHGLNVVQTEEIFFFVRNGRIVGRLEFVRFGTRFSVGGGRFDVLGDDGFSEADEFALIRVS